MLQHYIVQNDLKAYYPGLSKQIWNTQSTYETQIDLAFEIVIQEMYNAGYKSERLYTALDLRNVSATANLPPISATETSAVTGSAFESFGERRVLLDIGAMSGSFSFYIDGNSKTSEPASTDSGWAVATSFTLTSSYANSKVTQVMDRSYSYLRYRISPTTGAGTTITYSVIVLPTSLDEAIKHKALEIIFTDFVKEEGDVWDVRRKIEAEKYKECIENAKLAYDTDEDNLADEDEAKSRWQLTLVR